MNISSREKIGSHGQGALEYIILLAVCSAMLVFAAPWLVQLRDGLDEGFSVAVQRMLDPQPPLPVK